MRTIGQSSHFAHEFVDKITSRTSGQLNKTGDRIKNAWGQFITNCQSYIIDKPLRSVLIITMLGLVLSGVWMEIVFAVLLLLVKNGVDASSAILFSIAFNVLLGMLLWDVISNEKI
ncbi:hypothetical protein [Methylobacter psychrophilus]|uniref:hypothetical protein n=1 Tax=Methylobacter psychrophilus TaxID=96941 RepID=UPI0021D4FB14|nr:hypothetical protein [Methylobacter psychrophilus]